MKRSMDLIREILLTVEQQDNGVPGWKLSIENVEHAVLTEHLVLTHEAGLIEGSLWSGMNSRTFNVRRLTWRGHEFLDNIRDPEIWQKTKLGAEKFGGFSIDVVAAIAKGLVKKKIKQHTDIDVDL